jgi:hypothetical protein
VCQTAPDGGGDCRIGGLFTLRGAARNTDFDVYVGPDLVGTITTNASGIGALPVRSATRSVAGLCPTLVNVVVALRGYPTTPGPASTSRPSRPAASQATASRPRAEPAA